MRHARKTPEEKLAVARVLVVGAGGLGSAALLGLARAGVRRIGVVDSDRVEETNLHRQVLYTDGDVGAFKVLAARARLQAEFAGIEVDAHVARIGSADGQADAWDLMDAHDVTIDATDDPAAKFLLNDTAVLSESVLVTASAVGLRGHLLTVKPGAGPCLRCLFEGPPSAEEAPGCDVEGVLGPVPGVLGALEAGEAVRAIVGGRTAVGRLVTYEGVSGTFRIVEFDARRDCAVCGDAPTIRSVADAAALHGLAATGGRP
jgi:adenylyltransferase/sulfurtransferase